MQPTFSSYDINFFVVTDSSSLVTKVLSDQTVDYILVARWEDKLVKSCLLL